MNIEKLKKERKQHKICALPLSEKEFCDRYEKVTTPMVNDVLREMNLLYQTFPNIIMRLKDNMKVAGIVFTIKCRKYGGNQYKCKCAGLLHGKTSG